MLRYAICGGGLPNKKVDSMQDGEYGGVEASKKVNMENIWRYAAAAMELRSKKVEDEQQAP